MKIQKFMVSQKLFQQKFAKLSKQHFLAIVVKPKGLESGPEKVVQVEILQVHVVKMKEKGSNENGSL